MKLYAFAAFLALSLVGLAAEAAKADQPCCGDDRYQHSSSITHKFRVVKHATVFGCDGYHCETNVVLKHGITIKARCRNGWCELRGIPMKNVWVLEACLDKIGYSSHGTSDKYRPHSRYNTPDDYSPPRRYSPSSDYNTPSSHSTRKTYSTRTIHSSQSSYGLPADEETEAENGDEEEGFEDEGDEEGEDRQ